MASDTLRFLTWLHTLSPVLRSDAAIIHERRARRQLRRKLAGGRNRIAGCLEPCFQLGALALKILQLQTGAGAQRGLHVELFAGNKIELGETALQLGADGLCGIFLQLAEAGRQGADETCSKLIE